MFFFYIFQILITFLMSLGLNPSAAGLEAEVKIAFELWIISAAATKVISVEVKP